MMRQVDLGESHNSIAAQNLNISVQENLINSKCFVHGLCSNVKRSIK